MVGEIEPETLRERLDAEDAPLVVDVRSADAFAEGHLPGSRNVPLADIPGAIDEIADADHVVAVCPHGLASVKAARIVEAYRDFDGRADSLAGGLEAWDGPLETGEGDDRPTNEGDQSTNEGDQSTNEGDQSTNEGDQSTNEGDQSTTHREADATGDADEPEAPF